MKLKREGTIKENLLLLKNSDIARDRAFYKYIITLLDKSDYAYPCTSRGDIVETARTHKPCDRSGKHEKSKGDYYYKPIKQFVEIKAISKQTGATPAKQGTYCQYHLIFFIDILEWRLIPTKDLVVRDGKFKYSDNVNKGVRVEA